MADYYIQDKTAELNKRIDDAFTELDTQRNRQKGLTQDYNELKKELLRLQAEQKSNLLCFQIVAGISTLMWIILFILIFI